MAVVNLLDHLFTWPVLSLPLIRLSINKEII